MRLILVVTFIGSLTCQVQQKAFGQIPNSSLFLDTITQKDELSADLIRSPTSIDSIWYSGQRSDARFTLDTVFRFSGGFTGAIIEYDDRSNCIYKFLLVFRTSDYQNTANKIIYTDCDRDESAGYNDTRYKLLNDSKFETIKSYWPPGSQKAEAVVRQKWKISGSGTIYSVK
jgi:hypothetical protein